MYKSCLTCLIGFSNETDVSVGRGEQQVFSMVKKVRYSQGIWTCECIENYLDDQFQKDFDQPCEVQAAASFLKGR